MSDNNGSLKPRFIVGLVLIGFAVTLFLNNIGFGFIGLITSQWPVALIVIGMILLFGPNARKGTDTARNYLPYFLIGGGVLALLIKYHVIKFSLGSLVVPMVLLFLGVHVLRSGSRHGRHAQKAPAKKGEIELQEEAFEKDRIDVFALLGGGDYSTRSQNLTSGSVVSLLGGAEVDIREADTQGQSLELDVLSLMGGVVLKIPPHWYVTVNVLPLLGGISNKTTCLADKMNVPKKNLIIKGVVIMGGVDIRN